jgi:hypothetical protein
MTEDDADDAETWLLEAGDAVVEKKAEQGAGSLSALDKAIYCLWVIDYAVRNSGTLGPVQELYPGAKDELLAFARASRLDGLAAWLAGAGDEKTFCATYYRHFDGACGELRRLRAQERNARL